MGLDTGSANFVGTLPVAIPARTHVTPAASSATATTAPLQSVKPFDPLHIVGVSLCVSVCAYVLQKEFCNQEI